MADLRRRERHLESAPLPLLREQGSDSLRPARPLHEAADADHRRGGGLEPAARAKRARSVRGTVRAFLTEYETSHSRHVALLNDVKYLEDTQREIVLDRQRDIVAALREATGARLSEARNEGKTRPR